MPINPKIIGLFERCLNADYSGENEHGVRWAIERDGDRVYVLFDATGGPPWSAGWRTNYRFWPKRWRYDMRAHAGFVDAWESVRDEVIASIPDGVKRITCSGYSQGGALAQLAYLDVGDADDCVAFAAPRVFWPWWSKARKYDSISRVFVRGDTVTHLPPTLVGYRHVGESHGLGWLRALLLPFGMVWQLVIGSVFHHPDVYRKFL